MHQLGDQWIEIIDGQEHMVKAVKIIGKKNLCLGCVFHTGSHADCCDTEEIQCFEEGNEFIVKDLGILRDGLLQNCWGEYPKLKISADTKTDALFWYRYVTRDDVFCMTEAYKSEQEAKDAWNRRA